MYELGQEVVASGAPVLQRYGVSDDDAFAVGLTCGGILDVFVETVSQETFPELGSVADDIDAGRPVAVATVIEHPEPTWVGRRLVVHPEGANDRMPARRRSPRRPGRSAARGPTRPSPTTPAGCSPSAAPRPSPTAPTASVAARGCGCSSPPTPLARGCSSSVPSTSRRPSPHVGSFLGYRVTVCDARPVFATGSRFPAADEVVVEWPHRYLAAEAEAGRVDPRTVDLRAHPRPEVRRAGARGRAAPARGRLRRRDGLSAHARGAARAAARGGARRSPSLRGSRHRSVSTSGARTPEETAVSIAAEIVALQWGGGGGRLQDTAGPIHHHPA